MPTSSQWLHVYTQQIQVVRMAIIFILLGQSMCFNYVPTHLNHNNHRYFQTMSKSNIKGISTPHWEYITFIVLPSGAFDVWLKQDINIYLYIHIIHTYMYIITILKQYLLLQSVASYQCARYLEQLVPPAFLSITRIFQSVSEKHE